LEEAHVSYEAQLNDANKHAAALQQQVRAAELRADEAGQQLRRSEEASARFQAERDALLTMVSKLHSGSAAVADPRGHAAAHHAEVHAEVRHPVSHGVSERWHVALEHATRSTQSSVIPAVPVESRQASHVHHNLHVGFEQKPTAKQDVAGSYDHDMHAGAFLHPHHNTPSVSRDVGDDFTATGSGQGAILLRSRSGDKSLRESTRKDSIEFDDSSSSGDESDSEDEEEQDVSNLHARASSARSSAESLLVASATSNVLDMSDHGEAGLRRAPVSTRAPEIAGMLSSSSAKAKKLEAKKKLSESAKKSAGKKAEPIKGTPISAVAKLGTPGSGASGKSMVVRKPPSYTGASNDRFVRGRSPSVDAATPKSSEQKKTPTSAKSASKASAAKRSSTSGRRAASASVTNRLRSKSSDQDVAAAVDKVCTPSPCEMSACSLNDIFLADYAQIYIPASFSNPQDVSWESETLSLPADRSAPGAPPSPRSEPDETLDAAGLTISSHHPAAYQVPTPRGQDESAGKITTLTSASGHVGIADVDTSLHAYDGVHEDHLADDEDDDGDLLNHTLEVDHVPGTEVFSYHDIRQRAESFPSGISVASEASDTKKRAASAKKSVKHSGITDIKISRKSSRAPDTAPSSSAASAAIAPAAHAPAASEGRGRPSRARTPSPMLRSASNPASARSSTSGANRYYTPVSYSLTSRAPSAAMVVTPASTQVRTSGSAPSGVKASKAAVSKTSSSTKGKSSQSRKSLLF
jgi:hypothetical protein